MTGVTGKLSENPWQVFGHGGNAGSNLWKACFVFLFALMPLTWWHLFRASFH